MGQWKFTQLLIAAGLSLSLAGCLLEDQGTETVGSPVTAPPDFTTTPGDDGNNASNDVPPEPPVPTPTPPVSMPGYNVIPNDEVDLIVNGGATHTNSGDLHLEMVVPRNFYSRMKISYAPDCSDGDWEPIAEEVVRPVPSRNSVLTVGVRYMDDDYGVTQCVVKTITHDDQPPVIIISKYPVTALEEGSTAALSYSVTDASPIADVSCSLNQLNRPCGAGEVDVSITALPEGNYTFLVEATDIVGNTARQQVSWNVVRTTKHLIQSFLVNNYNKVDVLIVDDNSGSMEYEQKSMAKRTANFLNILQGLDYRIAVTTTDPSSTSKTNDNISSTAKITDGLFIPIWGLSKQYYIDSTMNFNEAQERLGKTLQRSETGSSSEQAIYVTHRVIERAFQTTNNPVQRNFFRDGAHFAVLVISDEDESANKTKNTPQSLLNLIQTTFNGQKAFSWHSIITKPGDKNCKNTYGATYGERYQALSELTGGIVGSVCESDYAAQLMGIAEKIRNLVKTMTLSCPPLTQFPILVKRDGADYPGAFTVEGVNLNFATELPAGNYTVDYRCLNE